MYTDENFPPPYNNFIYNNNFIDNYLQASDCGSNFWNGSYLDGGNYWSDYSGVDNDNDGYGDSPYYILDGDNIDYYPLIKPKTNIIVDSISGGFRVTAKIKNNGTTPVYDVPWSIDIGNTFYIRPDDEHQVGVIDEIPAGESVTINQRRLFAIGRDVGISVSAGDDTVQKTASWVLGPLVLGLN
jgi:hypothetical protein